VFRNDVFPNRALTRWLIVGLFAAVALVLGYIGLRAYVLQQYLPPKAVPEYGRGWADILFYDVQLFVFAAAPASGPGPIPLTLGIARFLAPATTVAATVETVRLLLSEQLRRWAAARASGHAIVTGDGPVAAELARKLRAEYRTVVLVSTAPAGQPGAAGGRDRRLIEVPGDPTDAGTLRAAGLSRADVLYACTELSTTNARTSPRAPRTKTYKAVLGVPFSPGHPGAWRTEETRPPLSIMSPAGAEPGVQLSYRVDDIAAAVERVRAAGGHADDPVRRAFGLLADCADDQGVTFRLWQAPY
jgi:predicted enzyme related to lactoylglutathione lyase